VRLQHEVIGLRRRVAKLTELLRLASVVLRVTGFSFHHNPARGWRRQAAIVTCDRAHSIPGHSQTCQTCEEQVAISRR
jgi:hypothetical protein